ncbi:MAG: mechanosensitive ion channel [Rhodocyclaceae bacterium]|nr:mechanosensitive ion channel [Rhodocyclaceae bacterium]
MTAFEDWLLAALKMLGLPQVQMEFLLLGVCLLLAAGLVRLLVPAQRTAAASSKAMQLGLGGLRRLAFPVIALILLLVARFFMRRLVGGHSVILPGAMTLLLAMLVLRMLVFALQHTFSGGRWLVASMRVVAILVWLTVALHLLGVLPDVIALLDDISITVGKQRLSLWLLLQGTVSVAFTVLVALWIGGLVEDRLRGAESLDSNLRVVFTRLSKALLLVVAVLVALPMVGIDLTTLSVFSGALGVGLGFGLQKIASNYVSGFIILLDHSIKLGSVISVESNRGEVTRITTRYTVLRDLNGVEAIVPNEVLVGSVVKNESYTDTRVRHALPVQVAYGTDLEQALAILERAALGVPRVLADPPPQAFVVAFADSGINLQLGIWIADPQNGILSVQSDVNLAIWRAFREADISIPFPQREVRMIGG